jgi:hypothetical protein
LSWQPIFTDVEGVVDLQVALVIVIDKLETEKEESNGNQ